MSTASINDKCLHTDFLIPEYWCAWNCMIFVRSPAAFSGPLLCFLYKVWRVQVGKKWWCMTAALLCKNCGCLRITLTCSWELPSSWQRWNVSQSCIFRQEIHGSQGWSRKVCLLKELFMTIDIFISGLCLPVPLEVLLISEKSHSYVVLSQPECCLFRQTESQNANFCLY